jgi:AcrR family transcriptional regulator
MRKHKKTARKAAIRVPLTTKLQPSRATGRSTFEDLLSTAGELLSEVGFEGLSTNLICKRAGMTPPALYRYFPNKGRASIGQSPAAALPGAVAKTFAVGHSLIDGTHVRRHRNGHGVTVPRSTNQRRSLLDGVLVLQATRRTVT